MNLLQIIRQLKDCECSYILIESALFFGNSAAKFSLDGEAMVDLKKCIKKLRHIDKTARIFVGCYSEILFTESEKPFIYGDLIFVCSAVSANEIKKLFDKLEPTDIISNKLLDASIKNSKAMEYITDKERGNFSQLSRENGDNKIVILYWD